MNIQEATKRALENDAEIYRESAKKQYSDVYATIKPTNSYDTCILIVNKDEKKKCCRNWNPTADDLMADDWSVIKE